MNEQEQASLLAQWLEHRDRANELDPEVKEAVLALRPDLAPTANVDIDEILNEVLVGPLASEADSESITALMQWMEQRPGQAPPSDTDPEVMEAVLAMRPDLAPPLRVDMAQILGQVTSGPLASDSTANDGLVSLGTVRSQHQDRKGTSIAIGFGLLAAAATTLFAINIAGKPPVEDSTNSGDVVELARTVDQASSPPPQSKSEERPKKVHESTDLAPTTTVREQHPSETDSAFHDLGHLETIPKINSESNIAVSSAEMGALSWSEEGAIQSAPSDTNSDKASFSSASS